MDARRTAGLVEISLIDPDHPHARQCLAAYLEELAQRFEQGFDPGRSVSATSDELRPPSGLFVVAMLRGGPVGCGGLKLHGAEPAELKRMWTDPAARGLGIARRILAALEQQAAQHGAPAIRLETNRSLVEAIAMYRAAGYVEVDAFSDEPYAHHWFEKRL